MAECIPGRAAGRTRVPAGDSTLDLEVVSTPGRAVGSIRVPAAAFIRGRAADLYTGPRGGLYTGPGGGLYTGSGGGLYTGRSNSPYRSNWPTREALIEVLKDLGLDDIVEILSDAWGL